VCIANTFAYACASCYYYCIIIVHLCMWNVCQLYSSALNTQLVDSTFPADDFEVVLGSLEVKWQRIGPYLFFVAVMSWLSFFSHENNDFLHNT